MTRINTGKNVLNLTNQHCFAEYREITRIPSTLLKTNYKIPKIPSQFTLGTGHMTFFYDKVLYLYKRYEKLLKSCQERGYKLNPAIIKRNRLNFELVRQKFPHLWTDYDDSNDGKFLENRILERFKEMDDFHYFKEKITRDEATQILFRVF